MTPNTTQDLYDANPGSAIASVLRCNPVTHGWTVARFKEWATTTYIPNARAHAAKTRARDEAEARLLGGRYKPLYVTVEEFAAEIEVL